MAISLKDVLKDRNLTGSTNYEVISGGGAIQVNSSYIITDGATYTLPQISSVAAGDTVVISKVSGSTPVIAAGSGNTIGGNASYAFSNAGQIKISRVGAEWRLTQFVNVQDASAVQAGVVNTGNQTFGGNKTFSGTLTIL